MPNRGNPFAAPSTAPDVKGLDNEASTLTPDLKQPSVVLRDSTNKELLHTLTQKNLAVETNMLDILKTCKAKCWSAGQENYFEETPVFMEKIFPYDDTFQGSLENFHADMLINTIEKKWETRKDEWGDHKKVCSEEYIQNQVQILNRIIHAIGYNNVPFQICIFGGERTKPDIKKDHTELQYTYNDKSIMKSDENGKYVSVLASWFLKNTFQADQIKKVYKTQKKDIPEYIPLQQEVKQESTRYYFIFNKYHSTINLQDEIGYKKEIVEVDDISPPKKYFAKIRFVYIPKFFNPGYFPIPTNIEDKHGHFVWESRKLFYFEEKTNNVFIKEKNSVLENKNASRAFNIVNWNDTRIQPLVQTPDKLWTYIEKMEEDKMIKIAKSVLYTQPFSNVLAYPIVLPNTFSHVCEHEAKEAVDQKQTGTCWLQAGVSLLHALIRKKYKKIELSVQYLMFYDKYTKALTSLKRLRKLNKNDAYEDRVRHHILHVNKPVDDGGTWAMFVHLVKTYGLVPKECVPTTHLGTRTRNLNKIINTLVCIAASQFNGELSNLEIANNDAIEEKTMTSVVRCLVAAFGVPPNEKTPFDFTVQHEKNDTEIDEIVFSGNPLAFLYNLNTHCNILDIEEYTCVLNAPSENIPYGKCIGPWSNDHTNLKQDVVFNVKLDKFTKYVQETVENGTPVWFTADVSKNFDMHRGILHMDVMSTDTLLNIETKETKEERIHSENASPNHAMLLTGVHIVNGKPVRWRVQNSWGKKKDHENAPKKNGFLIMDHEWFENHVYHAVIKNNIHETPTSDNETIFQPWSIFGTVAKK